MTFADLFLSRVRQRLEAGAAEYGDASHHRPDDELIDEIQQELEDVCGWAAILWAKLDRLKHLDRAMAAQDNHVNA